MPEVIETTVYRFEELSEDAKENARAWYREGGFDYDWYAFVFEDFGRICERLGVRLKTSPVRLVGGGTRDEPKIHFTGFWSQGDGTCFQAHYSYRKGASRAIRDHAPNDTALHVIADGLQKMSGRRTGFLQSTPSEPCVRAFPAHGSSKPLASPVLLLFCKELLVAIEVQ